MTELLPINTHLFLVFNKLTKDQPSKTFIIKNSSKRKIKNRYKLKTKYIIRLWELIKNFNQNNDNEMNVLYLDLYSYKFQKKPNGVIIVYKIFKNSQPILLGQYQTGQLKYFEWDLMTQVFNYEKIGLNSDIFENLLRWQQAQSCIICRKFIVCDKDTEVLIDWQRRAVSEKEKLQLETLEVCVICVDCRTKYSVAEIINQVENYKKSRK